MIEKIDPLPDDEIFDDGDGLGPYVFRWQMVDGAPEPVKVPVR